MTKLLIAAGGGGDAITAAVIHAALHGADAPALVLTYAWERLVVDPVPGPRRIRDFAGLDRVAPGLDLITPASAPRSPAGSLLPRLSGELAPRLGLLDPYEGVAGLARRIRAAARWCGADRVDLVDVGGDIVARGDEPTLRSPLGDALAVAACAAAGLDTTVYVAGPGLDNEVPLPDLLPRLGPPAFALEAAHTRVVGGVFDWHPSEASALLVAAARGVRGVCGTRDSPRPVSLDDTAGGVHRLTLERVLALSPLGRGLAGTTDLEEAEEVSRSVCGFSEIARERGRAAAARVAGRGPGGGGGACGGAEGGGEAGSGPGAGTGAGAGVRVPPGPGGRHRQDAPAVRARFAAWEREARAGGLAYVTTRRIVEELDLDAVRARELLDGLRTGGAMRSSAPLWRLAAH
ncbi:DUF1152 domain-containing protein [Streptomyces sp. cmx-4-9]|uniref:DUF1152 domain-containing protein n=1 Tax=Streptomyces sp. cmx-4-9 TaxID=2790941 RepID=UPI00397EE9EB